MQNDNTCKINYGSRVGFFFLSPLTTLLCRWDYTTVTAALVKPVIGGLCTSTPLALKEFSLVSWDKSGYRQPLPPELGDLPLHLDDDGYFSVNGTLDFTVLSLQTPIPPVSSDNQYTIHRLSSDLPGFSGENAHFTLDLDLRSLCDDTISRLVASPPIYSSYYAFLSNECAVDYKHVPRGGVTTAASLVAPGDPHSRQSRH